MDDASFHCLVYSTSHWSNAHKAFNHVFRAASHFPLLSPVFVKWRQRGDHCGCAGVKHGSGEWTFRGDQPAGLSEKSSTHAFPFLGRLVHLQLTNQETQKNYRFPKTWRPAILNSLKGLILLPFTDDQPILDIQLGKDVWRGAPLQLPLGNHLNVEWGNKNGGMKVTMRGAMQMF